MLAPDEKTLKQQIREDKSGEMQKAFNRTRKERRKRGIPDAGLTRDQNLQRQEQIRQATLMLASELFAMRNAPLGVAGVGDFGVVNIQQNREITRMIAPFRKGTVLGVA